MVNSHLNEAQRERLAALESSESSDDDEANDEDVATRGRGGKTKASSPPVAPDAHGDPAGSLGGGTTGQGARGFPSGPSPGSWAWRATPSESTPRQRARPPRSSAPEIEPRPRP